MSESTIDHGGAAVMHVTQYGLRFPDGTIEWDKATGITEHGSTRDHPLESVHSITTGSYREVVRLIRRNAETIRHPDPDAWVRQHDLVTRRITTITEAPVGIRQLGGDA